MVENRDEINSLGGMTDRITDLKDGLNYDEHLMIMILGYERKTEATENNGSRSDKYEVQVLQRFQHDGVLCRNKIYHRSQREIV